MMLLTCLSNFRRNLRMSLINFEMNFEINNEYSILNWSENCVISFNTAEA